MAQLAVEMTGDEARLWKSFQKIVDQQNKLQGGLDRTSRKGRRAGKSLGEAFGEQRKRDLTNLVIGFGSVTAVLGAVRKAAALVTDEFRLHIELQRQAGHAQISLKAARDTVRRTMLGRPAGEQKEVLATIREIAKDTSVDERILASAMSDALSATGMNIAKSKAALRVSAEFMATKPEGIARWLGAQLDIEKATGSPDPLVNLGLMAWTAGHSRVVKPRQQAKNIPPAIISMMNLGAEPLDAAALFAALTTAAADVEGERTRTASINLVRQLGEFRRGPEWQGLGLRGQIGELQQDPRQGQRFLAKATFDASLLGPIRTLIEDPESVAAKEFAKNLAELPGLAELRKMGKEGLASLKTGPLAPVDESSRIMASAVDRLLTADAALGMAGVTREGMVKVLKASGQGALATRVDAMQWELSTGFGARGVVAETQRQFRERLKVLKHDVGPYLGPTTQSGIPPAGYGGRPSDLERKQAAILEELLVAFRRVEALLAEANDDRKQVKANTEAGPELTGANEPGVQ